MKRMAICLVEGCEEKAVGHGLCMKHYKRFKRHGSVNRIRPLWKGSKCRVEGCNAEARIKGYCTKHYKRAAVNGTPDDPHYAYEDICSVPGCNKQVRCKGLCYNHYYQSRYYIRKSANDGGTSKQGRKKQKKTAAE